LKDLIILKFPSTPLEKVAPDKSDCHCRVFVEKRRTVKKKPCSVSYLETF
jgi:hypothetical protein